MNAQQRNNSSSEIETLAEPFSQIFVDRIEADWAFDLLLATVKRLGLKKPNDERFALTFPRQSGKLCLHLNFGQWLVLGFRGPNLTAPRVEMALLADQVSWNERFTTLPSERKQGEPEVRSYHLPIETVRPMTSDLQTAYETTLDFIAQKFHAWKRSPYWKSHNPEIIEALFDLDKREQLFAGLFAESELRYERHYTAFYEIAEEEGIYEITENLEDATIQGKPMKIIKVDALDGIKDEFQTDLYEAMRECNNPERIMVCLYFLSDLPYDQQKLDRIEKTLRKIFPPSLGEGYKPENYVDFQAMVRGYLGDEYRKVKRGSLAPENTLWETRGRGYWRNTTLGNQRAIKILEKKGLQVIVTKEGEPEEVFESDELQLNSPYPLPQLSLDTGYDETELARWIRTIERKGQIVLYGPPGTGKTFLAEKLAQHLIGGSDGFAELVQFHPAYAYEDFIQGLRPQARPDGGLDYPLVPGRFLEFCRRAKTRQDRCVLIIDEINRANLARVFGELMYLLEYRNREIPLAGGSTLQIPANVRLIGTMNTADRSIALVDHALRRRFAFIQLAPNFEVLRHYHQQHQTGFPIENLIIILTQLNQQIGDAHYFVGITFFLHENLASEIEDIWQMEIEPYLEEYFFDQPDKVDDFRWTNVKKKVLD
jgi:5-methylcytosine-specific restriction protein B